MLVEDSETCQGMFAGDQRHSVKVAEHRDLLETHVIILLPNTVADHRRLDQKHHAAQTVWCGTACAMATGTTGLAIGTIGHG